MKTDLVQIGNSRGIRIPKLLIEQAKLGKTVNLRVENECLIVSTQRRPREGWEEMFHRAGSSANDEILFPAGQTAFDRQEWEW